MLHAWISVVILRGVSALAVATEDLFVGPCLPVLIWTLVAGLGVGPGCPETCSYETWMGSYGASAIWLVLIQRSVVAVLFAAGRVARSLLLLPVVQGVAGVHDLVVVLWFTSMMFPCGVDPSMHLTASSTFMTVIVLWICLLPLCVASPSRK